MNGSHYLGLVVGCEFFIDLYDIIMRFVLCTWVSRERWKLSCRDLIQKPTVFLDPATDLFMLRVVCWKLSFVDFLFKKSYNRYWRLGFGKPYISLWQVVVE